MGIIISFVFYKVLAALLILYKKTITLPNISKSLDSCIADNTKYFFYFENCLRVLDGTHLLADLSFVIVPLYQDCTDWLSQNILGVCKIHLIFYYILVGWEGFTHDNRVLKDVLFNKDFQNLDKKYYLTNTRYYNMDYLLCSYHNI